MAAVPYRAGAASGDGSRRGLLVAAAFLTGCGAAPGTPLVTADAWVLDLDADPWPDHHEPGWGCPSDSLAVELDGIEIDTQDCRYAVLTQPLRVDVRAGDAIDLLAWHNDLVWDEPAEAHFAIAIGPDVLFDVTEPIPSDATVWREILEAPADARAGTGVVIHLHNHGANVWNVNHLEIAED